ncbi:MAG TPA: pilus assembly protein N-terminal domain-containing protein [Candidatus Tripitaka californicus]|uniref:pilus assembly protein N-terminal domain-containing protein n=1 Tax=Candidatus Tripitaka californicus TaxID=3367616 RepID=UPI0040275955|nr:pilus assembly protein N-terminal domain-containing protein [Planctomycetota bacterium]
MFKLRATTGYISILLVLLTGSLGCGNFKQKIRGDDLYLKNIKEPGVEYSITDQDILEFSNNLRHMFRAKMQFSTIAAYASSVTALATATAAATLAATGGSTIGTAGLAAASLFTGDGLGLFKLKERINAYVDGLELIEEAEAKYFNKIAKDYHGKVSNSELTSPGAELYVSVVGSLKLVEKALAARIPTKEDIEAATGEVRERARPDELRLNTYAVSLKQRTKLVTQVIAIQNGPITDAVSDDPKVATGEANGNVVTIKAGETAGKTEITVSNGRGEMRKVEVEVKEYEVTLEPASTVEIEVHKAKPINDVKSENTAVAGAEKKDDNTIEITAKSVGTAKITVTNKSGAKEKVIVHVEEKP